MKDRKTEKLSFYKKYAEQDGSAIFFYIKRELKV